MIGNADQTGECQGKSWYFLMSLHCLVIHGICNRLSCRRSIEHYKYQWQNWISAKELIYAIPRDNIVCSEVYCTTECSIVNLGMINQWGTYSLGQNLKESLQYVLTSYIEHPMFNSVIFSVSIITLFSTLGHGADFSHPVAINLETMLMGDLVIGLLRDSSSSFFYMQSRRLHGKE